MIYDRPEKDGIAHRINSEGKWEYWNSISGEWHPDNEDSENYGPEERFSDYVVSYEDTWCEPYNGMFKEMEDGND